MKLMNKYQRMAMRVAYDSSKDTWKIEMSGRGDGEHLAMMLRYIQLIGGWGHSFDIVVDPDNSEYSEKFGWDGDGADKIGTILLNGKELEKPEKKPYTASDDPKFVIKVPSNDKMSLHQVAEVLGNIDAGFEMEIHGNTTFFNIDANTDEIQKLRRVAWRHNIEVD